LGRGASSRYFSRGLNQKKRGVRLRGGGGSKTKCPAEDPLKKKREFGFYGGKSVFRGLSRGGGGRLRNLVVPKRVTNRVTSYQGGGRGKTKRFRRWGSFL